MGKIRMCNVFLFVLEYTIVFVSGETELLDVTLCETSGNAEVSCPENKTIAWKSIDYGEFSCQNTKNREICHSNINAFFNDRCLGQNNCTLPVLDILSNNSCERSPIRVKVSFTCSRSWWRRNKHPAPKETCANTLTKVNCPSDYHIHFKHATFHRTTSSCDEIDTNCATKRLYNFCNEKRSCISDGLRTSCLYHQRFASIQYACKGPTDLPITDSIRSTSTDRELKTTTIAIGHATSEYDELPELSLDKNHRVVIYLHSQNQTQLLCSSEWDDDDAAVLCRHLNSTWIGNASVVDTLVDIPIANYALHCNGFETSLFKCNFTVAETGCNTTTVAGAMCCQGTNKLGECVTFLSPEKEFSKKSGSSTLGIAVGIPVAMIAVVCVIVLIVFIRRRHIGKDSDRKRPHFICRLYDDDYVGQQNIALPKYPSNKKVPNSQETNNSTNPTQNEDDKAYSYPSKDSQSPYALSEEGVYDQTNERRHVVNDTDSYSRTIDTVYDSAEQNTRLDSKEETYDHVFGQKTEDHYDKSKRT